MILCSKTQTHHIPTALRVVNNSGKILTERKERRKKRRGNEKRFFDECDFAGIVLLLLSFARLPFGDVVKCVCVV